MYKMIVALAGVMLLPVAALNAEGAPIRSAKEAPMSEPKNYLSSPQAMADLHAINAGFIENFVRNDVKSHDALLHPDFIAVQSDGSRISRAAYLTRWATGFDPEIIIYWDVRDELITLIGNVALVRSTNKQIVRRDGRDIPGMSTYTDTYIYENGAWKCIQAQITPVAAGKEPGDETIITKYLKGVRQ